MKKLFEFLIGVIILLMLIATTIDIKYLFFYLIGLSLTIFLIIFCCYGEKGWTFIMSIISACFLFIFWIFSSTAPLSLTEITTVSLLMGGALFPNLVAKAYLDSKEPQ